MNIIKSKRVNGLLYEYQPIWRPLERLKALNEEYGVMVLSGVVVALLVALVVRMMMGWR